MMHLKENLKDKSATSFNLDLYPTSLMSTEPEKLNRLGNITVVFTVSKAIY